MKSAGWWIAAATLLAFYLIVRHFYGSAGSAATALLDPGCPENTKALVAPTLAEMYDHSAETARKWKADAVLVRMDNLAMQGPLKRDGTSTKWTAGFYSPEAKAGMLMHTGDGVMYCSHHSGEELIPDLKPDFMRDGAALYAIAEKHGREYLDKGRGIGVTLWRTSGDPHAAWHLQFVDGGGYPADRYVVVDANTGKLEEVRK